MPRSEMNEFLQDQSVNALSCIVVLEQNRQTCGSFTMKIRGRAAGLAGAGPVC